MCHSCHLQIFLSSLPWVMLIYFCIPSSCKVNTHWEDFFFFLWQLMCYPHMSWNLCPIFGPAMCLATINGSGLLWLNWVSFDLTEWFIITIAFGLGFDNQQKLLLLLTLLLHCFAESHIHICFCLLWILWEHKMVRLLTSMLVWYFQYLISMLWDVVSLKHHCPIPHELSVAA